MGIVSLIFALVGAVVSVISRSTSEDLILIASALTLSDSSSSLIF